MLYKFFEEEDGTLEFYGDGAFEEYQSWKKENSRKNFGKMVQQQKRIVNKVNASRRKEVFDAMEALEFEYLEELQK